MTPRLTSQFSSLKICQVEEKSMEIADEIFGNEELLTEILIRLPLRFILEVRSVSHYWEALISSPRFAHAYTLRNLHHTTIFSPSTFLLRKAHSFSSYQLLSLSRPDLDDISVSTLFDLNGRMLIDQSTNGLLLCRNYRTPDNIHPLRDCRRFVYNPTTNRTRQIPTDVLPGFGDPDTKYMWSFHLGFDPEKSPFYKVICVGTMDSDSDSDSDSNASYFIHIYSSETGKFKPWSQNHTSFNFSAPLCFIFSQGVYWKSAVNWVLVEKGASHSLYFDVQEDRLGPIPSPPVAIDGRCCELNDELLYLDLHLANDSQFKIYAMSTREGGWSLRYTVTDTGPLHSVLCLVHNNERGRLFMLHHHQACILAYDVKGPTFDPAYKFNVDAYCLSWGSEWYPVFPHTPSLASV